MLLYSWSFCDPQTLKYFGLKNFLSWEFAPCSAPSKRIPSSPPCKRNFIFYIWCQQCLNLSPPCIKRNFIFYTWCQQYLNLWSEITLEAMSCSSYFSWTCRYFPQTRRRSCERKKWKEILSWLRSLFSDLKWTLARWSGRQTQSGPARAWYDQQRDSLWWWWWLWW